MAQLILASLPSLCLLFLVDICCGAVHLPQAFLDPQAIHDAWAANYTNIPSMKVRLTRRLVQGGGPDAVRCSHWETIDDGNRFYVRTTQSPEGFEDKDSVDITSFDGRVRKAYTAEQKSGEITSSLSGKFPEFARYLPPLLLTERMRLDRLGPSPNPDVQRFQEMLGKESPAGVPGFTFDIRQGSELGHVRVLPTLESVSGQLCHVVEIEPVRGWPKRRFWFAHERSMLLMRWAVPRMQKGDYSSMEVLEVASVTTDSGELWYPRKATQEVKSRGEVLRYELDVQEFGPYLKAPPSTFDVNFPPGTRVTDFIAHASYTVGADDWLALRALSGSLENKPTAPAVAGGASADENDQSLQSQRPRPADVNNNSMGDVNARGVRNSGSYRDEHPSTGGGIIRLIGALLVGALAIAALLFFVHFKGQESKGKEVEE
jgi:hypothetical protein